jgi:hypothetical protein
MFSMGDSNHGLQSITFPTTIASKLQRNNPAPHLYQEEERTAATTPGISYNNNRTPQPHQHQFQKAIPKRELENAFTADPHLKSHADGFPVNQNSQLSTIVTTTPPPTVVAFPKAQPPPFPGTVKSLPPSPSKLSSSQQFSPPHVVPKQLPVSQFPPRPSQFPPFVKAHNTGVFDRPQEFFAPNSIFPPAPAGSQFKTPPPSKQFKRNPIGVQELISPPIIDDHNLFRQSSRGGTRNNSPQLAEEQAVRIPLPADSPSDAARATKSPEIIKSRVEAASERTEEKPSIIEVRS